MTITAKTTSFIDLVSGTIARHGLLNHDRPVIVALSGGADSVALLATLKELRYDCVAAHCNYHLRGEESQRDMRHSQTICDSLGVTLMIKDFDVAGRKKLTGESTEMACRELRYAWFGELMDENQAQAIAVGHHLEDRIETFMLNLMRGTGIYGLTGIKYRRDSVVRPLLDCSRIQIEEYLSEKGLEYIVDSSNVSDEYLRNRLRNRVLPEIGRCFSNYESAMLLTMSNLAACAQIYDSAIDEFRRRIEYEHGKFDLSFLPDGEEGKTILYEILKSYGITAAQCHDIASSKASSGLIFEGRDGVCFELSRGKLERLGCKNGRTAESHEISIERDIISPVRIAVSEHDITDFNPGRNDAVIYLDSDKAKAPHRWVIRPWRKGDRIRPFGMKGSKLISDLFVQAKYSERQKRELRVLTCDDVIVWAIGLRASDSFKVTSSTMRYLKLEYIKTT